MIVRICAAVAAGMLATQALALEMGAPFVDAAVPQCEMAVPARGWTAPRFSLWKWCC